MKEILKEYWSQLTLIAIGIVLFWVFVIMQAQYS